MLGSGKKGPDSFPAESCATSITSGVAALSSSFASTTEKMDKAYAVFIGRQPGVYNTWEEANDQVSGFKHQTHRSFNSTEDAVAALSNFQEGQVGEHVGSYSQDKAYAVFIGRQPGVYNTWEHANVQVSGFKHQTHRSFSSTEEAVAALSKFQEGQVGEHVGSYSEVRSSITSASNSSSSGPGIYSSKQAVEMSYQSHKQ